MRKLNTTNLELAVWIARLGSFTAAAERMHTTQPAVSARVKELEDMLGHKLFARQGRGVEVTPEGREFVTKAEGVLKQLDELSISFSKASAAGVVRIGTSSTCLELLAPVSMEMARAMPLVSYDIEVDRAARLLYRLESRKIDIALLSGPLEAHKFRSRSLGFDRMLWVTSPRVRQERLLLPESERLRGLPIWCVHPDSFYWSFATGALRALGGNPDRINAISNTMGIARIVAAGAGVGLVSERLVWAELASGALVSVPELGPCATIEFSIVTMADSSSSIVDEVVAVALACSPFSRERLDG